MSELRWNPMLGQWVITATHRQDRTYKPPAEFCPFVRRNQPTSLRRSLFRISISPSFKTSSRHFVLSLNRRKSKGRNCTPCARRWVSAKSWSIPPTT